MNIDIRTVALVLGVAFLLQAVALFLLNLINKAYQGLSWWVLGFAAVSAGVVFLLTVPVAPVDNIFNTSQLQVIVFLTQISLGILATIGLTFMAHQRLNAANRQARENSELIFNTGLDAVLITRLEDGKIVAVNDGFVTITGFNRAEAIGKTTHEINIWKNPADRKKVVDALSETGSCEKQEVVFQRKNGSQFIGVISAKIIIMQNVSHIISVTQDISERKRAEQALRESEARFRSLFDDSPISLWEEDFSAVKRRLDGLQAEGVTDFNRYFRQHPEVVTECIALVQVLDVNKATLDLYGASSKDTLVKNLANSQPEVGNEYFRDELVLIAAGKNRFEMDMTTRTLSGKIITINLKWAAIPGYEADLSKVIVSIIDISASKQVEEVLLAAHAELENRVVKRTAELRAANRDLEKAAHMKDEFLASMSHELRTPLTGILGLSEVMQLQTYGPLSEKQLIALAHIHKSGQHLLELINDILDLSRIEAGKLDLNMAPCSLSKICQSSLQMISTQASAKKLQFSLSMNPETIQLNVDGRRIKQIIANLLSNAVKFTPNGGSFGIEVDGIKIQGQVQITVWDTGIGIKEQDLPLLFRSFVQLDARLARQYNGTGLGLALVRRLTELHGGSVSVQSIADQGSRFTVRLPWSA